LEENALSHPNPQHKGCPDYATVKVFVAKLVRVHHLRFLTHLIENSRPKYPNLAVVCTKSISDWKNLYLTECEKCSALEDCGGLFKWTVKKHSEHIHAL
jgi:hypothetical protein